jgi:hypothetical protein
MTTYFGGFTLSAIQYQFPNGDPIHPGALYSQEKVAVVVGKSARTLEKERLTGRGIPYTKVGRLCRYLGSDIIAVIEAGRRFSTSDPGRPALPPAPPVSAPKPRDGRALDRAVASVLDRVGRGGS